MHSLSLVSLVGEVATSYRRSVGEVTRGGKAVIRGGARTYVVSVPRDFAPWSFGKGLLEVEVECSVGFVFGL